MRIDTTRCPATAIGVGSYQKAGETIAISSTPRATDGALIMGILHSELTP